MTIESKSTKTITDNEGVSMLIYSDGGFGKTTLAGTLDHNDTLIIDCDGGLEPLKDFDIPVWTLKSDLSNNAEIFDELKTQEIPKTNIFFDGASELEKSMLIHFGATGKNHGAPSQNEYNIVYYKMRDKLRALRDLKFKGHNVFVTALEMPHEVQVSSFGDKVTKAYPMLGKSIAPEIVGLFDVVGHLEVVQDGEHEGKHYIRLDPTESICAKCRYDVGPTCVADLNEFLILAKGPGAAGVKQEKKDKKKGSK